MYFKLFIFCIHAVAATSHKHHLREKSGHHDIVFKGTKSQLHRLLKGDEEAKHAEALQVLRGSHRFLPGINCDYEDENGNTIEQNCDRDTEECKHDECEEVCDPDKDCNGNGECKNGECECYEYFEDADDCSRQDVIWQVNVVSQSQLTEGGVEETRSPTCIEAIRTFGDLSVNLLENLSLPSAITVNSKSRRTRRRRRLTGGSNSQRGPIVQQINVVPGADCTEEGLTAQVLKAVDLALVEEEDPVLPDALVCLIDESKKILKHTDDEDGLKAELDGLLTADECAVADAEAACITDEEKCHEDIEDDCEDELESSGDEEGEDDCEGLHRDLKKCYEKCYGL